MKPLVVISAINLALAVGLGAFGAHALKDQLAAGALETYKIGSQYHQIHGIGALAASFVANKIGVAPAWLLLTGTWIFGFSLYLLAVTGTKWLGAIAPIGGVCLIGGYLLLAYQGGKLATL